MNRVDVVVPCYNYARYLERCADSLLNQEGVEVRVLVIDDASSDDTPEVAQRLAARDPRLEFRRHAANRGHIATYNEGLIDWASSEYSLLISADDVLAPGALRRATSLMEQHRDVGMTYGMALVIQDDADPPVGLDPVAEDSRILPGAQLLQRCCERAYCPISAPTVVVRTSVQQAIGGYSADRPHSGDLEMWMKFAVRGPIGVLRSVQAFYRWHAGNMSVQYYAQLLGDRREFLATCQRVLAEEGARLPDTERWLKALHWRVAIGAVKAANACAAMGDEAGCRAWLEFSRETYPRVTASRGWWRSQAQRVLVRAWRGIRPAVNALGGAPRAPAGLPDPSRFKGFRPGQQMGWWPDLP